ncbi:ATP-binding protein [Thermomonas sp. HDW16]|uniref:ATP-binding protein n=1 Tax=Thermomonas sp. HDW16 TaxID=2714945 RepID=UPI00140B05BE|nr:ATP-binding protein [Thermomonas sp. HDW16]QIL19788.1 response regulator [Thermomonas sp. HDW16]
MNDGVDRGSNLLTVRWLALGAAAGVALTLALDQFDVRGPWQGMALALALLALFATTTMALTASKNEALLREQNERSRRGEAEVNALQLEINRHTQLEDDLTRAKQAAEAAVMAKGEFLATMSHEIRTPLNGIVPMLDLLMHSRMPLDQMELVRTAFTSSHQMLRIVDDILDYSKLEADKLQLETTGFNLRELLESVITLMERPAESKGLRLQLNIEQSVRLPVRGDPVRLRQVLSNLISNAVKFTERGNVALNVKRMRETAAQHQLRFEVRDTGIGISKSAQDRLFQAFSQADASTTRLYGGTGLGLAICQRIVTLMGGNIGVDSEQGQGSTFWFEIPLLKVQGDMPAREADLTGARVLLITADGRLRQRLAMLLPNWGMRLTTAENTHDALERLRQAASQGDPWTYSVVLGDLGTIRSTALSLARNLERTALYGKVRLLYLRGDETTSVDLPSGASVIPRGAPDPDLRAALSGAQTTHIDPFAHRNSLPAGSNMTQQATPRILLVEDNPVNLMVAQRLLQVIGMDCETAGNGQVALEKLQASAYDLVLMDCQMPVLDGYAATRRWREHEHNSGAEQRIPIIAMTANAMAGDRQKCLDAGMDDYLAKPVTRAELERCISRWRGVKLAVEPITGDHPAQQPGQPQVLNENVLNDLREVLGGEVDKIIALYLEDAPRLIAQLERAAVSGDPIALRVAAHTLKSSSANVGATTLSDAARDLEHGARDGTLAQPANAVARIVGEFAQVRAALQAKLQGG